LHALVFGSNKNGEGVGDRLRVRGEGGGGEGGAVAVAAGGEEKRRVPRGRRQVCRRSREAFLSGSSRPSLRAPGKGLTTCGAARSSASRAATSGAKCNCHCFFSRIRKSLLGNTIAMQLQCTLRHGRAPLDQHNFKNKSFVSCAPKRRLSKNGFVKTGFTWLHFVF